MPGLHIGSGTSLGHGAAPPFRHGAAPPSSRRRALRSGPWWARVGPWRGGDDLAYVAVAPDAPLDAAAVGACIERARNAGYRGLLTSALGEAERPGFLAQGFTVREHLHLLRIDLAPPGESAAVELRRARRRDHHAVLTLDAAAFPAFWRLGPLGLQDALRATPTRRFRVAGPSRGEPVGYAITGLDGATGYLQRIAVHPTAQRQGVGRALVADGLRYLWRHGAAHAFVNTQADNDGAVALYTAAGFAMLPAGLAVLGLEW
jgi:ribosomal protein S18 acetylase RimI-like enzyme